jgi:hypothetical protein
MLIASSRMCAGAALEGHPAGRKVELIIGAKTAETDLLEPSIHDMLAEKGLTIATSRRKSVTGQEVAAAIAPPTEATPSVARILLDFTVPGQGTLFLIDPRRGRVYVRRMALPHGLDAVARAGVRFIVEQSIDAILEGREIGVSREEFQRSALPPPAPVEAPRPPPPPASPPPPPPPPTVRREWLLAGAYEGLAMGAGEYQQGAKIMVAARFERIQLAVAARLAVPMSVSGEGADARLWTGGASVSGAAKLVTSGALSLAAGLGAGLDLTHVAPTVTGSGLEPAAAFWAPGPWVQPFATLERLFGTVSVALCVGAELHPLAERYTIQSATGTRDVFVPWRLRPVASLLVGAVF